MVTGTLGLRVWLGCVMLAWSLYPYLFAQARGVLLLMLCTAALALLGAMTHLQVLMVWSGGLGLANLTLALILTDHPPNLWVGLGAGLTLLALLDGHQHFTYLYRCRVEAGVLLALWRTYLSLSGLSVVVSVGLGGLALLLYQPIASATAGVLTIVGAGLFVSAVAVLLLSTSRE